MTGSKSFSRELRLSAPRRRDVSSGVALCAKVERDLGEIGCKDCTELGEQQACHDLRRAAQVQLVEDGTCEAGRVHEKQRSDCSVPCDVYRQYPPKSYAVRSST